ncbi:MAG: glutamate mutase L [Phototrophicaceae bacterium]
MTQQTSILAADFGSIYTRVLLIDVVDGEYRLIARSEVRTTAEYPDLDVNMGLRQGIQNIEVVTGRTIMDPSGNIITPEGENRIGVDHFLTTASGGEPLRAVVVGLIDGVSIDSGLRATEGTYVQVLDILSLHDGRTYQEKLNLLINHKPNLILMTGGLEGGAKQPLLEMIKLVRQSLNLLSEKERPVVLYAGNSALVSEVKADLGELTTLLVADNVRPSINTEELDSAQLHVAFAFDRFKVNQGRGYGEVGGMSSVGLLPTAYSYRIVTDYLGRSRKRNLKNVVAVDVGSSTSTLASYYEGDNRSIIRADIGLGRSALQIVERMPIDSIRRWIPFSVAEADVRNYALNKNLQPASIPLSRKDLYFEYALLRAGIENMLAIQRPTWHKTPPHLDWIIGAGSALAGTGNYGLSSMLLLDAIQPAGLSQLYADPNGLIPAIGALAYIVPEAVVQLLDGNNLEHLGTAVSLDKAPRLDRKVLKIIIQLDGQKIIHTMNGGELFVYPLPPGKEATVQAIALGSNRIGGKQRVKFQAEGSLAGLIFDTRGRPIPLSTDIEKRSLQLVIWIAQASLIEPQEFPEYELRPVEERNIATLTDLRNPQVNQPTRKQSSGLFGLGKRRTPPTRDDSLVERITTEEDGASDDGLSGGIFDEDVTDADLKRLFKE